MRGIERRALRSARGGLEFNVQKPVLNEAKDLFVAFVTDPSKLRMRGART
jgi:hypothetical protein